VITGILLGILTGLLTNEMFEFSPWCARKLVRWAAFRRYTDRDRAEMRAEEWTAVINDRPGKLFKLITAASFAAAAIFASGRRAVGRESNVGRISKTGLLNAANWERRATAEVDRAVRTRTSLAVAILNIDRFKMINDTYGQLVGDQVLTEIARTLASVLRDYDFAGRYARAGQYRGEEFTLLLPQTRAVDAFRMAERVRASVASMPIIVPSATGGEGMHVTVSIGVAALDAGSERKYAQLMEIAHAALCLENGGRDQVKMFSSTRGLCAQSGSLEIAAISHPLLKSHHDVTTTWSGWRSCRAGVVGEAGVAIGGGP
jgi:diguanylate cyclase (GGDEF)-like protein